MAVLKWKGVKEWVTLYSGSIKNKLRKDANLADVPDKVEALKNMGLIGDISDATDPANPTDKHNHDKRYQKMILDAQNDLKKQITGSTVTISGDMDTFVGAPDANGRTALKATGIIATKTYVTSAAESFMNMACAGGKGANPIAISNAGVNNAGDIRVRNINSVNGDISTTGAVYASRTYNAVWNDYAELFPIKKGTEINPGELVAIDMDSDEECYIRAGSDLRGVVGVCSDEYAHLIGGDEPENGEDYAEFNKGKFVPVALAGRVHVYVNGPARKGSYLVPDKNGAARVYVEGIDDPAAIIGMLVETDSHCGDKRLLRMKIKA